MNDFIALLVRGFVFFPITFIIIIILLLLIT